MKEADVSGRQQVERVIAELEEVIAEEAGRAGVAVEEVKYDGLFPGAGGAGYCRYVLDSRSRRLDDDTMRPGCIVGHWLHYKRGVTLKELISVEGDSVVEAVAKLRRWGKVGEVGGAPLRFLRDVQCAQDRGDTWVAAMAAAKEAAGVEA